MDVATGDLVLGSHTLIAVTAKYPWPSSTTERRKENSESLHGNAL